MIKTWLVTYVLDDYGSEIQGSVIIDADNEYAAINKAEKQLEEKEARPFWIINCEEINIYEKINFTY